MQVRLDRATCTDSFLEMFLETNVENLITEESDHLALLVHVLETAPTHRQKGPWSFRFEDAWTKHDDYERMVTDAWAAASTGISGIAAVWDKIHQVSGDMQRWSRAVFGLI